VLVVGSTNPPVAGGWAAIDPGSKNTTATAMARLRIDMAMFPCRVVSGVRHCVAKQVPRRARASEPVLRGHAILPSDGEPTVLHDAPTKANSERAGRGMMIFLKIDLTDVARR
jgi:hypothetical protein